MVRRGLQLVLAAVLAAVVASALAASARSQEQPLPADNGWIAFASDRNAVGTGRFRLHRLDVVGGRVTELGLAGRQPAWSPDGTLLAFVQNRFELVITRPDGIRVEVLVSRYPLADPAWSPDGSRIVVTQTLGRPLRSDLAIADVTRSTFTRITRTADYDTEPSWSPDGAWIAFVSDRAQEPGAGGSDIYLVTPDGRRIRRVTSNDFDDRSPAWSPDGSRLALVSGRVLQGRYPELWTMTPDGRNASRVQPASGPGGFPSWSETSPSWSPDGRWLVYVTTERWYLEDIFIVEVDGDAKFDLTPGSQSFDIEPAWQPLCIVAGTRASDNLRGTELDELICGHGGADTISGGGGTDRLFGGVGNDRMLALDRTFDVIGCGAGKDTVVADRRDLIGGDCERVRRR